ncbi:helix-turn-helix transcriptional regulator [Streptosporangium sp. NBC_01755]|uniref:Scr1 family TA system antitoxin-like transcriptional regulator n=1 Tax=Streptosporangium sp. NBC_01755 TaxID=2975949 RepID=UPI002DD889F7|nr:Scr1 family TA system antitoxin-like transcriptional regulator [Streptosporangium sp. NBC_01755]WSD02690.1 helix-turn-helix transcriptional regulator [Streptosporangium sp. NBC_01755]
MLPPTDQAREALGARLRELRRDAELSGRDLAERAGWRPPKVSKLELGRQNATEADIRTWCRVCGAEDQIPELIATVRTIDAQYVEWKRQMRGGRRRVQNAIRNEDLEAAVGARLGRQAVLRMGDRRFHIIMAQQALDTWVGSPEVMRGQLAHVRAEMEALPLRLHVGVIPRHADIELGPHAGYWIFDSRIVMTETVTAGLNVTQPREIALYERHFAGLDRLAVYGERAHELIGRALHEIEEI